MGEDYRLLSSSIRSFLHSPCYLVPVRPKYSPQHPILRHPQPTFLSQCEWPSFTPIQNNRQKKWFLFYVSNASCLDIAIRPVAHKQSDTCLLSIWWHLHSVSEDGTPKVQRAACHLHRYRIARLHLCELKVKVRVNSSLSTPWRRKGEQTQILESTWKWPPSHPGRFALAETADPKHSGGFWVGPRVGLVLLEKREMFCPCSDLNPRLFQLTAWSLNTLNHLCLCTVHFAESLNRHTN